MCGDIVIPNTNKTVPFDYVIQLLLFYIHFVVLDTILVVNEKWNKSNRPTLPFKGGGGQPNFGPNLDSSIYCETKVDLIDTDAYTYITEGFLVTTSVTWLVAAALRRSCTALGNKNKFDGEFRSLKLIITFHFKCWRQGSTTMNYSKVNALNYNTF